MRRIQSTEICFSKLAYRSDFQIILMGSGHFELDVMNHSNAHSRSRATVSAHSFGRTVMVGLLVTLVPVLAVVAASAVGLTAAFLAGATSGAALHVARRRTTGRGLRRGAPPGHTGTAD